MTLDDGMYHGLDQFFDECRREMQRHFEKKGEQWREDTIVSEIQGPFGDPIRKRVATPVFLEELLQSALNTLMEEPDPDQRVDVANILGMLWMWDTGQAEKMSRSAQAAETGTSPTGETA